MAKNKRGRLAAEFQLFIKQYARKAGKNGHDPNDRKYDYKLQEMARRMKPEELDGLLRDGEDENKSSARDIRRSFLNP